jgi:DNA-binding NtrC family response regulator
MTQHTRLTPPDADLMPVAIIDDEADMRDSIAQWMELSDFAPQKFANAAEALDVINADFAGVVITDVRMPGMDGLELLAELLKRDDSLPVILITGHGDVAMAVEAMRAGAYDFIEKPFDPERLADLARRAATARRLTIDNRLLRRELADGTVLMRRLMGDSAPMQALRATVLDYAQAEAPVLVRGERGAGRSLIARVLHASGPKPEQPFITINCAAEDGTRLEEQLFKRDRSGNPPLLAVNRGALCFKNISALPPRLQALLTDAIERRRLPDGTPVTARVISIAEDDHERDIEAGALLPQFAEMLSALVVDAPALRDCGEDILTIFNHYCQSFAHEYDIEAPALSAEDAAALLSHPWPGNMRQLINTAERYILRNRQDTVSVQAVLDMGQVSTGAADGPGRSLKEQVETFERLMIENALRRHSGAVTPAMTDLGLPRRTLNEKMAKYGISRADFS